ncbi:hypothetical protein [Mesorhizobium sp.]|uniref:hypothetical protein n=1 Tax=Mesorhizobium sp. TaxID=1871066 RepID=UPI00257DAE1A|nr:hypothetical protein [Mesorhizobium sp.]
MSEHRAELDLQIGLLNEHETTRLIETALTERLKVPTPADDETASASSERRSASGDEPDRTGF